MKYVLELEDDIYLVVEKATKVAVDGFYGKLDALKRLDFFNDGGGFDGWTPSFMVYDSGYDENE